MAQLNITCFIMVFVQSRSVFFVCIPSDRSVRSDVLCYVRSKARSAHYQRRVRSACSFSLVFFSVGNSSLLTALGLASGHAKHNLASTFCGRFLKSPARCFGRRSQYASMQFRTPKQQGWQNRQISALSSKFLE